MALENHDRATPEGRLGLRERDEGRRYLVISPPD
jgi:hypothetical protein